MGGGGGWIRHFFVPIEFDFHREFNVPKVRPPTELKNDIFDSWFSGIINFIY